MLSLTSLLLHVLSFSPFFPQLHPGSPLTFPNFLAHLQYFLPTFSLSPMFFSLISSLHFLEVEFRLRLCNFELVTVFIIVHLFLYRLCPAYYSLCKDWQVQTSCYTRAKIVKKYIKKYEGKTSSSARKRKRPLKKILPSSRRCCLIYF